MRKWQLDAAKGLFESASLNDIHLTRHGIAIECARRLRAFHKEEFETPERLKHYATGGACFLLMRWGSATKARKQGMIQFSPEWRRENVTIWANCTDEFYDGCVEPLVRRFTEVELQSTFGWNRGMTKGAIILGKEGRK